MHVTIRLFARLREMAGAPEINRTLPDGSSVRTAWDSLVGEFPGFDDYSRAVSCAVNEEYARMTTLLSDGDDVAFLPPVSGGSREKGKGKMGGARRAVREADGMPDPGERRTNDHV